MRLGIDGSLLNVPAPGSLPGARVSRMTPVHEARFYEPLADRKVLCTLCPHDCRIPNNGRGACSVLYNRDGRLYTLAYDKVVAREVNPIEKKPLFHFHPGSYAYSISTVGCNLRCSYCQNWQISQWPKDHLPKKLDKKSEADAPEPICPQLEVLDAQVTGEPVTPAEIVRAAKQTGCLSISYTFTEPTIFYELACDTAVLAREHGLKNSFVSNGFIGEEALREIAPLLDAVNFLAVKPRPFLHQHRDRLRQGLANPEQKTTTGSQPRPAAAGARRHSAISRARRLGGGHHAGDPRA